MDTGYCKFKKMNNEKTTKNIYLYMLDRIVFILLYMMLFIDILNGYCIHQNISLPISVSQLYKLLFLSFVLISFLFSSPKRVGYIFLMFLLLFSGPLTSFILYGSNGFLKEIVLIFKLLTSIITYFYFRNLIYRDSCFFMSHIKRLVFLNFLVITANMFLGSLGFGYEQYTDYSTGASIGTVGYFYAGNELSILMIIIFSLISVFVWMKYQKSYMFLSLLLLFLSLLKATKAAILGVVIVIVGVPFWIGFRRKVYKYLVANLLAFVVLPIISCLLYVGLIQTGLYNKLLTSFNKYDIITFLYSNRNNFASNGWDVFNNKYSFFEKLFGVGQERYLELSSKAAEIDFVDMLFYYGYIGCLFLLTIVIIMLYKSYSRIRNRSFVFSRYSFFMILLLFFISLTAGHTFFSGLAGPFIGLVFALPYYKIIK